MAGALVPGWGRCRRDGLYCDGVSVPRRIGGAPRCAAALFALTYTGVGIILKPPDETDVEVKE
jgi:hypothetical protein